MRKLFILLAISALFSSCIWGKRDWHHQQQPNKKVYGLSGRPIGRGW